MAKRVGGQQRDHFVQRVRCSFLCASTLPELTFRGPDSTDAPFDHLSGFDCQFPTPHSNAFIDLDGDCLADLFLTCQNGKSPEKLSYQIWLNDKKGKFKLARKGDLPYGIKSVGFADMGACEGGLKIAWTSS